MPRYVARRLLAGVPLIVGVLAIAFGLIHLAPGDPIQALAGDGGDAAYYAAMRARYGLDRPVPEQFGRYALAILRGDLGYSFSYGQPVSRVILDRLPATLLLTGTALVLATALGIGLGVLTALRPHGALDHTVAVVTLTAYAMPVFWLGQLLVLLFAVRLGLLPVQGMISVREGYTGGRHLLDVARHLALPALTLALPQVALNARLMRTSLREALAEEYIATARAKGLAERAVIWRHALRNALLPVVTALGGLFWLVGTSVWCQRVNRGASPEGEDHPQAGPGVVLAADRSYTGPLSDASTVRWEPSLAFKESPCLLASYTAFSAPGAPPCTPSAATSWLPRSPPRRC